MEIGRIMGPESKTVQIRIGIGVNQDGIGAEPLRGRIGCRFTQDALEVEAELP